MNYAKHYSTRQTPQSEPIPGRESEMAQNAAGGFAFVLDDWGRLDRFLVLGTEGGTYYVGEHEMTKDAAAVVARCIAADGPRVVARIVEVSVAGRAPKNDPALFALAMAMKTGDPATRSAARAALPRVARTGTHLFHLARYVEAFGGWGRGTKRAFGAWYTGQALDHLALQLVKYRQRDGWTHRDVLRLAHPTVDGEQRGMAAALRWAARGSLGAYDVKGRASRHEIPAGDLPPLIAAHIEACGLADNPAAVADLVRRHNLPREAVPTEALDQPAVWEALLERMPMTAMIRNLATMTRLGVVSPGSDGARRVCTALRDGEVLRKARVHPLAILVALRTYQAGHGERGKHTWEPVAQVLDALDDAFYAAFEHVEPSGARVVLALDVSGSMAVRSVSGFCMSAREVAAALAMVTARCEPNHVILGFTGCDDGVAYLPISPRQRLDDVVKATANLPFGPTDAALPMLWAQRERYAADAFVVYTDNESWCGNIHPIQALRAFRERMKPRARLASVAMTATASTIGDPQDAGVLSVVGMDTSVPQLASDFVRPC